MGEYSFATTSQPVCHRQPGDGTSGLWLLVVVQLGWSPYAFIVCLGARGGGGGFAV